MSSIRLNKKMGCKSPRCRRCKCRDNLPLMEVSHWNFLNSEKADRLLPETQVRRPTGMTQNFFAPVRWAKRFCGHAKKATAAVMFSLLPRFFVERKQSWHIREDRIFMKPRSAVWFSKRWNSRSRNLGNSTKMIQMKRYSCICEPVRSACIIPLDPAKSWAES